MDYLQLYAKVWNRDPHNNLAVACYDQNSLGELRDALSEGEDEIDMANWGIMDSAEWREAICAALEQKKIERLD